jgi:small subunit ribosomal protein S9
MVTQAEEKILEDKLENKEISLDNSIPQVEEKIELSLIGKGKYIEAVGRRKRSSARVRIWDNDSDKEFNIIINGKNYLEYFQSIEFRKIVESALKKIKAGSNYKVTVKVSGGGVRGQAEAIRLGIARALVSLNSEWKPRFKKSGFLTRDPREVERKKYGKRKARKEEQWSKR